MESNSFRLASFCGGGAGGVVVTAVNRAPFTELAVISSFASRFSSLNHHWQQSLPLLLLSGARLGSTRLYLDGTDFQRLFAVMREKKLMLPHDVCRSLAKLCAMHSI